METKKNLWGCGYPTSSSKKKKKSSKKKDSESMDIHVNLATSLIKYVKKRCTSFTVKKRNSKKQAQTQALQKQYHRRKPNNDQVTLRDWILESPADGISSGEFYVFKQSVLASKKIHPASQTNPNLDDDDFGSVSRRKSYYSMDHMENLNSGDGANGEDGASSSPPRRNEHDTGRKRVSFTLPLVTDVYVLESADHPIE